MESKITNGVSAIQCGDSRIEYLNPDFASRYACIAVLIAQARGNRESGRDDLALQLLDEAFHRISDFSAVDASVAYSLTVPRGLSPEMEETIKESLQAGEEAKA